MQLFLWFKYYYGRWSDQVCPVNAGENIHKASVGVYILVVFDMPPCLTLFLVVSAFQVLFSR